MKFRTLVLVIALGCGLTVSAAAKKKTSHSTPATVKRTKVKRPKSNVKRQKVKRHKVNR